MLDNDPYLCLFSEENGVTQDNLWFNTGQRHSVYNSDDDEVRAVCNETFK